MALITIPSTPEKGVPQTYILNVTDLIALISDPYFQQQTNWSKVVALYQSSVSNQIEAITFIPDGVSTTLSVDAEFSLNARDVFDLNSIMIIDDQNGRNIIYAASIPDVANYTIDMTTVPVPNLLYVKDFSAPDYAADLSFNAGTTWVLNGSTAWVGYSNGSFGSLEMTLTNTDMLAGLVQGDSYIVRIYVASTTGAGSLGGNLKGGYIDQNLFQFTNPLPPYYEQTVAAGAGSGVRLDAGNVNSSEYAISKIEIYTIPYIYVMDTFYNDIAYNSSRKIYRTSLAANWNNVCYRSTPVTGDFIFSGLTSCDPSDFSGYLMIGYIKNAMPLSGSSTALDNVSSAILMISDGQAQMYEGVNNTASSDGSIAFPQNVPHAYSIERAGSVITATIDGQTVFSDSYSGDLYLSIMSYNNDPVVVTSTDLKETPIWTNTFTPANDALLSGFELAGSAVQESNGVSLSSTPSSSSTLSFNAETSIIPSYPNPNQNFTVRVYFQVTQGTYDGVSVNILNPAGGAVFGAPDASIIYNGSYVDVEMPLVHFGSYKDFSLTQNSYDNNPTTVLITRIVIFGPV